MNSKQADSDDLEDELDSKPNIPAGAVDLCPSKVGPRILYLPDRNIILKAGSHTRLSEAKSMRFVKEHTSIPVPTILDAYEQAGFTYIFMSKLEGVTLGSVWKNLSLAQRAKVVTQLRQFMAELQNLRGDFLGRLGRLSSIDIFFCHWPFKQDTDVCYGPFDSWDDYNDGLSRALAASRPNFVLSNADQELLAEIRALDLRDIFFSHGDFHMRNILVNDELDVTGIVDWEAAGFSFRGRDHFEAKLRTRDEHWSEALDSIFSTQICDNYSLLRQLDQSLVLYTGI